jgi:hypothetical protein
MVTYVVMALGALSVMLLAGLTGAMPSPQTPSSESDDPWPSEPGSDIPTETPAPQLPSEILDALAEGRRLGRAMPRPSHDGYGVRGSVPGEFEDEPTT